jgi:hypothetical protein
MVEEDEINSLQISTTSYTPRSVEKYNFIEALKRYILYY